MKKKIVRGAVPAFLVALLFATSCQKDAIEAPKPAASGSRGMQVSLSSEEQEMFAAILQQEGVKDSTDFMQKIALVKSKSQSRTSSNAARLAGVSTQNNTMSEGEEQLSVANFYTHTPTDMPLGDMDWYFLTSELSGVVPVKGFKVFNTVYSSFAIRGNQVLFNIPCVVSLKSGVITKVAQMASALPEIQPVGAYWGTYTSSPAAYVQAYNTNSATVHAEGNEVRTTVNSTTGEMKISTEADVSVFKVGAEFGAGFVIQSAYNTYNQYKLEGTMTARLTGPYYEGEPPMFNFVSSLICRQWGILRNQ